MKKGLTVHRYKCIQQNSAGESSSNTSVNTLDKLDVVLAEPKSDPKEPRISAEEEVVSVSDSGRRGKERCEKHSAIKKSNVIDEYENGATQDELAEKYNINRSLVLKWSSAQESEKIKKAAVSEYKHHTKIRPSVIYKELQKEMLVVFQKARNQGYHVNFGWLSSKSRNIYRVQTGDPEVKVKKHVVVNFLKKYNIRMQAKQRNSKLIKESYRESLMKWHATMQEKLIRHGRNDSYDKKKGVSPQSPLPFANTTKRT